jgi:hypothetical protein
MVAAIEGLNIGRVSVDVLDKEFLIGTFTRADVVFHLVGSISIVK